MSSLTLQIEIQLHAAYNKNGLNSKVWRGGARSECVNGTPAIRVATRRLAVFNLRQRDRVMKKRMSAIVAKLRRTECNCVNGVSLFRRQCDL